VAQNSLQYGAVEPLIFHELRTRYEPGHKVMCYARRLPYIFRQMLLEPRLARLAWKIHSYSFSYEFNVILNCSIAHLILFFSRDITARIEALSLFLCFLLRQQR
jgi:hypothetical protein